MTTTITVIRGDGIGPEIMDAALHVLDALNAGLAYEEADAGLVALGAARRAGRLQSGYVYHYAFVMLLGVAGLLSYALWAWA